MNEETLDKTPFMRELEAILNRYCMENTSNTPDFILAEYMLRCLRAGEYLIDRREQWYGREIIKGQPKPQECPIS